MLPRLEDTKAGDYVYSRSAVFGKVNRYLVARTTKTLVICRPAGRRFRKHDGAEPGEHGFRGEHIEPETEQLHAEFKGQQKMRWINDLMAELEKDKLWMKVNHFNLGLVAIQLRKLVEKARNSDEK